MNTMHKWATRSVIAVSAAALTAGLTACGSDGDSGTDAGKSTVAPSVTGPSVVQDALPAPPPTSWSRSRAATSARGPPATA